MKEKPDFDEIIAGETVCFYPFEKYIDLARPKTLSPLMKATRAEAKMEAMQDKMLTPRQINFIMIMMIFFMAITGLYLLRGLGLMGGT